MSAGVAILSVHDMTFTRTEEKRTFTFDFFLFLINSTFLLRLMVLKSFVTRIFFPPLNYRLIRTIIEKNGLV